MAQITLNDAELRHAVCLKLDNMGLSTTDPQVAEKIEFTAGRGSKGFSATINLGDVTEEVEEGIDSGSDTVGETSDTQDASSEDEPSKEKPSEEESSPETGSSEGSDSVFGEDE